LSTSFESVYEPFFKRIENDKDFFIYYNMTLAEALELAKQRAKNILIESISELMFKGHNLGVDFSDYDTTLDTFNIDLTNNEKNLIVQLMFERYLDRDVVKLKAMKVRFTPSDLNSFSPAQERSSFMNMYDYICNQSSTMIDNYESRDRVTGKLITIDYNSYEY
jgi:hypothetical protein